MAKKKQKPVSKVKAFHQIGTSRSISVDTSSGKKKTTEYNSGLTKESITRRSIARSQGKTPSGLNSEIKAYRTVKGRSRGEWQPNKVASTYDASNIWSWRPKEKVPNKMTGKSNITTSTVKPPKKIKRK